MNLRQAVKAAAKGLAKRASYAIADGLARLVQTNAPIAGTTPMRLYAEGRDGIPNLIRSVKPSDKRAVPILGGVAIRLNQLFWEVKDENVVLRNSLKYVAAQLAEVKRVVVAVPIPRDETVPLSNHPDDVMDAAVAASSGGRSHPSRVSVDSYELVVMGSTGPETPVAATATTGLHAAPGNWTPVDVDDEPPTPMSAYPLISGGDSAASEMVLQAEENVAIRQVMDSGGGVLSRDEMKQESDS